MFVSLIESEVMKSDLVAVLSNPMLINLKPQTDVELNAGNSYDEDQRGLRGLDAGLSFHWSCQQKKPSINSDACPDAL